VLLVPLLPSKKKERAGVMQCLVGLQRQEREEAEGRGPRLHGQQQAGWEVRRKLAKQRTGRVSLAAEGERESHMAVSQATKKGHGVGDASSGTACTEARQKKCSLDITCSAREVLPCQVRESCWIAGAGEINNTMRGEVRASAYAGSVFQCH